MKALSKQDEEHFPESFGRISESPQRVIGCELKEVDLSCHAKALLDKLGLPCKKRLSSARVLPAVGLPMMFLGVVFWNSYHAREERLPVIQGSERTRERPVPLARLEGNVC